MTDEELEGELERLEAALEKDVQAELDAVGDEFAEGVQGATELVAAVFRVSSVRAMWQRRMPRLQDALARITGRARRIVMDELGEDVPAAAAEELLKPYTDATRVLLDQVGDRMAEAANQALADGTAAGDTLDELKQRLLAVFDREGAQLGPVRANRIAMTEATRAFNAGVQAAAEAASGGPVVKQWLTRRDNRVREAHQDVNGQLRLLDEAFDVGGFPMLYPGDPTAPADLTVNCRCILKATHATQERTASMPDAEGSAADGFQSRMPGQLKRYWLTGPGAAKIGWGTPGSFERCVRALRDDFPQDTEGLCANLYHEATGHWPGRAKASTEHTGAMVALMPSEADAARLALGTDFAEAADQLHVTLFYLGEASDWDEPFRDAVRQGVGMASEWLSPITANAFGAAHWNPAGESPVWVWNIGDTMDDAGHKLHDAYTEVRFALEDRGGESPDIPQQHSPWAPHIAAAYSPENLAGELAERCGPVVFDRIRVGFGGEYTDFPLSSADAEGYAPDVVLPPHIPTLATWSTPAPKALAFEDQQTGDSRAFAPGALYWDGDGPWPLMANENFDSHDDASLAGAIHTLARDGHRITSDGVLYLGQEAGAEATMLLAQGAPLGVSVDLDDVDMELVDATGTDPSVYRARLLRASYLPTEGGFHLSGVTAPTVTAGASGIVMEARKVDFFVGADCLVPRSAFDAEDMSAAAGDSGSVGTVVDTQRSGDYLMRITRGRIRGATLVTVPAFADAAIVLDDPSVWNGQADVSAAGWGDRAPSVRTTDYDRVLRHVRRSKAPVGPARVAQFLKIPIRAVQRMLSLAASRGEVVRLTRGLYTDSTTSARADHVMTDDMLASGDLVASVTGAVDLPVADRAMAWDGDVATAHVFDWANGDPSRIGRAYAYRDDNADPKTKAAYKLGYADVIDGTLTIVPRGVFAAQAALEGARGGVDIPQDEMAAVRDRLAEVRAHVDEVTGGESMAKMQASAWAALSDLPPMPAEWFREPTPEELPPGGPGVNYAGGRIFGWVAQSNVPHAGYAKRIVINELGRIDTTEFLRQRFVLDDGTVIKAGAFTMNAGHHRDGAECETAACQFDDTRTVAGVITVGMNSRGMWFSGAAAPWLSEWDRTVFAACQPSYHLKRADNGTWKLGAVLSVPVPGHPSALLASAVTERSQLALTAAATLAEVEEAVAAEQARQVGTAALVEGIDYDRLADSLVAAMARADQRKASEEAELEALLSLGRTMDA